NNVRIDDFCILSGHITIGSHVHIAAYSALYGAMGIEIESHTVLSSRVVVYSAIDDFGGDYLISPTEKPEYTHVTGGKVLIKQYACIGTNATIFPGLTINEGAVVGAHSFVKKSLNEWVIYAGCPVKKLKNRSRGLLRYVVDK
ncbi:MAG: acyltransferase, partial [Bacteroidaceae bacterium]